MSQKKEYFLLLLKKYNENSCSAYEKSLVESYFDECQDRHFVIDEPEKEVKKRIYKGIKKGTKRRDKHLQTAYYHNILKFTACLLVLLGSGYFLKQYNQHKTHTFSTLLGEKKEILLPDGSQVHLNSGSSITYENNFNKKDRVISLEGEAFFDVYRNREKPFIVATGKLMTRVLGTSFNIKTSDKENSTTKVSVISGKVHVFDRDHTIDEQLVKNNQLVYDHTLQKLIVNHHYTSSIDTAWKDGVILLNDQNLRAAANLLEKWFGITINIPDEQLKTIKVNGKFNNPSLIEVLESLKFSIGISYSFIDSKTINLNNHDMNKIRSD